MRILTGGRCPRRWQGRDRRCPRRILRSSGSRRSYQGFQNPAQQESESPRCPDLYRLRLLRLPRFPAMRIPARLRRTPRKRDRRILFLLLRVLSSRMLREEGISPSEWPEAIGRLFFVKGSGIRQPGSCAVQAHVPVTADQFYDQRQDFS